MRIVDDEPASVGAAREARAEAASFSGAMHTLRALGFADVLALLVVYGLMSICWAEILHRATLHGGPSGSLEQLAMTSIDRASYLIGLLSSAVRLVCVAVVYATAVGLMMRRGAPRLFVGRGLAAAVFGMLTAWVGYLCLFLPGLVFTARTGASTPIAFREGAFPLGAFGRSFLRTDGAGSKYLTLRFVMMLPIFLGTCLVTTVTEHEALLPMWASLGRTRLLGDALWTATFYLPAFLYLVFVAALDVHLDASLRPPETDRVAETFA